MEVEYEEQLRRAFEAGRKAAIESISNGETPRADIELDRQFEAHVEEELTCGNVQPVKTVATVKGYEDLSHVLNKAFEQAAFGKGEERHAGGRAFQKQPIMYIQNAVGSGYTRGQAIKKLEEAQTLLETRGLAPAQAELLGAIIYTAAAYLYMSEANNGTNTPNGH